MPTFGDLTPQASATTNIVYNSDERLNACCDECPSSGTADNITIYIKSHSGFSGSERVPIYCAIYEYIDESSSYAGDLLGITETINCYYDDVDAWKTFDMDDTVNLVGGTKYYLAVGCDGTATCAAGDDYKISLSDDLGGFFLYKAGVTSFPDPFAFDGSVGGRNLAIYCSYTESTGGGTALGFQGDGRLNFSGGSNKLQFITV